MSDYPVIKFGEIKREDENSHLDAVENDLTAIQERRKKANFEIQLLKKDFHGADRDTRLSTISSIEEIKRSVGNIASAARSLKPSPYFSRLDFKTDDKSYILYISKGPIKEVLPDRHLVHYVNWRAPIADLYYRYNNMPMKNASFRAPEGVKTGDISLVARMKIDKGKLRDMSATTLQQISQPKQRDVGYGANIEDDLQNKLASNSSGKMTEIVETIQSEQNEIVRHSPDEDIVIQGGAGSGKTAIALHRVAYLLYNGLKDYEVLFISPNKDFTEYISDVLPELGELNIAIKTFDEIYEKVFNRKPDSIYKTIEKYFEKGHLDNTTSILVDKRIDRSVNTVLGVAREMREKINAYKNAMEAIRQDEDLKIVEEPKMRRPFSDAIWNKYCSFYELGHAFNPKIEPERNLDFLYYALVEATIKDLRYTNTSQDLNLTKKGMVSKRNALVDVEHDVKHIVIDEAQDYTKWHIYLLHLLCPNATFTILGDKNQNINPYLKDNSLQYILREVNPSAKYFEINKAYRSSPEIVEYCNKILNTHIEPVRRSQHLQVNEYVVDSFRRIDYQDVLDDIRSFRVHGLKRIGIITRNLAVATMFSVDEITNDEDVTILPVYEAKGLEFDAVIVINTFGENEKELLYTACTRAQHELVVYEEGPIK